MLVSVIVEREPYRSIPSISPPEYKSPKCAYEPLESQGWYSGFYDIQLYEKQGTNSIREK